MAIRYKALTELYHETQRSVTAPAQWQAFLASACRNYRLSFDEQLLVYAQRPDATAVLEIERWNKRFGRWVNRGANGIAVFDGEHTGRPRLKYYFDISDTHEGNFPQSIPLWAVRPEYEPEIIETLENSFGELEHKEDLGAALLSAAKNAVEDNIQDYLSELKTVTEGSFLEELDEYNVEVLYRKALENSIGYMLMVRCGLDPAGTFEDEDFRDVLNFNTPETLNALGVATGDISQMCLSEISRTVLALQRQPQKENRTFAGQPQIQYAVTEQRNQPSERSFENERDHIHETGRLQPAEPSAPAGAGGSLWEIRIASEEVSERTPQDHLHEPVDQRAALQPSGGDRADGPAPDGADGDTDGQRERRDGGAEGARPDEVGRADEQPSERSGGDHTERADLQLISEPEQPSTLNAEEADSPELPAFLDEKQIMAVIANKDDDLKYKKQQIELFFSVHQDTQERADYLKTAYQDRYTEIIADGQRLGYKPQEDGLLMWEGSYPSRTKEAVFSWGLVAEWTAQLIDKKEYFIQTDIRKLPTQEGQQMSLFDFGVFSQPQSEGGNQISLFSHALPQQVIDEALCIGSNHENSRLTICAYFKKDKPDNARFLAEHYGENGAGFCLDGRKYAVWYNAEGIRIAGGESAQGSSATLISWEQAAARIRELLELGRYMPQSELDQVDHYEIHDLADRLLLMFRDIEDEEKRFFPSLRAIYDKPGGFPEAVEEIAGLLGREDSLQAILSEYEAFAAAYQDNPDILRFRFYRPLVLQAQLTDLQREPLHFTAAESYDPQRRLYISMDEIDRLLRGGKRSTDYRLAVYSFYRNHTDRREREDFLKNYHGEYSGYHGGNDNVTYQPGKGVHFSHGSITEPYAKVELKWNAVEKRVSAMIAQGRFLSEDDRAAMPQYEKHQLARNIHTFFENVPQEQPHPYPFGFDYWDAVKLIEPQLDDPARVEEIYQMMVPVWEATPQDDRMYKWRQTAFENLSAFRQGTFTLFAEHKEPAAPAMPPEKAYDLGYGHLGNGLTVWNRLEEEHGDYKTVAHIAPDRTVQFYDEEMPQTVRDQIQHIADTSEMTVSATQDAPVFHTPPKVQEPPQKEEAADPYSKLAAQVLYFIGEFDGSRMGYGDTDAQAVETIAEQLHDPARREEIRRLLQSFLDHADPEEEIAADITLCIEEMEELPPALTPEQAQREEIAGYLEEAGFVASEELIADGIAEYQAHGGEGSNREIAGFIEREFLTEEAKLEKLNDQSRKDDVVTFEQLGVDRLFVDESHYFKNLFLMTKMRNVGGIAQTEAQKSSDLFMKCRYLDELTGGRGTIFATGTPISNSMVELYTIQRYLQYGLLQEMGLIHFDDWASDFGETITAIELSPEGTGYRAKTRFAKFFNLPELMAAFKQVADIQTADMLHLPVPKANFHTEVIKPSELQQEMVKGLAERAEKIRDGGVDPHVDNMLRITNDGRKLALDMRLINPLAADDPNGKVAVCARNVYKIWEQTKEQRSTQLVFCDLSTPTKDGSFNVYDDLKKKLMEQGIPEDEIAFIHDADSEVKKKALFAKVRAGQIRVLMGSTQKMGAGTNVQDRLIALHDLDCPWRPSDLQQRLGRIVRQGNENEEVEIFRYVTEGTFDAYLYQLVENKQKFIAQIMTSKAPVRVAEDVDETALSYSEIKALATGNPLIIEKCNLDMEVAKLNMLKASYLNQRYSLEELVLREYPADIARITERIAGYEKDVALAAAHPKGQEGFCGMVIEGKQYAEKEDAGKAIIDVCSKMTGSDAVLLGEYRGFSMVLAYDGISNEYRITLKGTLSHTVTLGADVFGNIARLDNALENLAGSLQAEQSSLEETKGQLENARAELGAPFAREEELAEKTARLNELNVLLKVDEKDKTLIDSVPDEGEEVPERKVVGLER